MSNIFIVGTQVFNVFSSGTGWRISVNGILLDETYVTRGDAWAAGLAELERIAQLGGNSSGCGGVDPGPDGPAHSRGNHSCK